MPGPSIRNYDKKHWKKCIKCRNWKPREDITLENGEVKKKGFGAHNSSDGLQSICFACKNVANTKSRERNVSARIRHHTATRCLTQLGELAPKNFTKDLEEFLGYKIRALTKHLVADLKDREGPTRKLRDALNEGYHIDHIRPLSSFNVCVMSQQGEHHVDWDQFRLCWDMDNLAAIPAAENLAKGAKREKDDARTHTEGKSETEEANEVQEEEVTIRRELTSDTIIDKGPDTRSSND